MQSGGLDMSNLQGMPPGMAHMQQGMAHQMHQSLQGMGQQGLPQAMRQIPPSMQPNLSQSMQPNLGQSLQQQSVSQAMSQGMPQGLPNIQALVPLAMTQKPNSKGQVTIAPGIRMIHTRKGPRFFARKKDRFGKRHESPRVDTVEEAQVALEKLKRDLENLTEPTLSRRQLMAGGALQPRSSNAAKRPKGPIVKTSKTRLNAIVRRLKKVVDCWSDEQELLNLTLTGLESQLALAEKHALNMPEPKGRKLDGLEVPMNGMEAGEDEITMERPDGHHVDMNHDLTGVGE